MYQHKLTYYAKNSKSKANSRSFPGEWEPCPVQYTLCAYSMYMFYPHDTMLAWVGLLAMALCLPGSICHKSEFYQNG